MKSMVRDGPKGGEQESGFHVEEGAGGWNETECNKDRSKDQQRNRAVSSFPSVLVFTLRYSIIDMFNVFSPSSYDAHN